MKLSHQASEERWMALSGGFSLVEVVLAMGVVSFAALTILGTLSLGFKTDNVALEQGKAARTLGMVASSLRAASTTDNITYTAGQPFTNSFALTWKATTSDPQTFLLDDSDAITTSTSDAHQKIAVKTFPPPWGTSAGSALIVVAWPPSAQITWAASTPTVTKAQGYEFLYVYLNVNY